MNIFELRRYKQIIELNEEEIASGEEMLKNLDIYMKTHFKGFDKEFIEERIEIMIKDLQYQIQHYLSIIMNFDHTLEELEYLTSIGHFEEGEEE